MSSPSKPLSIASPRLRPQRDNLNDEIIASQTPDLRQLRQQFGTPPVGTTIPPFRSPGTATPLAIGSPAGPSSSVDIRQNIRPNVTSPLAVDTTGTSTPQEVPDIAALGDEEKIKVLRKHLVSREERFGHNRGASNQSHQSSRRTSLHEPGSHNSHSRQVSHPPSPGPSKDNVEPFPLPYNAPGGDITYVHIFSDLLSD
jgi:solute carrier family 36 (proton-coupled amino acid transporter)